MHRKTPRIIDDIVDNNAIVMPNKTAIISDAQPITYHDFDAAIDRAARMLLGLGIRRGERVGLMFPNIAEFLYLYFGCFRIGAVVVPVNTRYRRREIRYALEHSECRLLIADRSFADGLEGLEKEVALLERIILHVEKEYPHPEALHAYLERAPEHVTWPAVIPEDPAVIFYTSGSTSRPKGVTHTHATLLANASIQSATREMSDETVLLSATGIGYIAGLSGLTLPGFLAGSTLVLVSDRSARNLLDAIERHRVALTLLLPAMLIEMLDHPRATTADLGSLSACIVAGDECTPDLYERYRQRTGRDILQAFGMTECEGYLANRPSGPNRIGTLGQPAAGVEVRLVDAQGNDVAPGEPGEPGELAVRAPSVMRGYWEDPEYTNETIRDGWLYGGDVALRDEEGFYTFVERQKEIIIIGGSNVGPHEIECVIDAFPPVMESCVVGVPDPLYGAALHAFVAWEPNAAEKELEALKKWTAERLAAYKVPATWCVMNALPKTPTAKIDRKALHLRAQAETKVP